MLSWAPGVLAAKETVANLWIVSQLEMQTRCPGPEDLDFFLCPICWCSAAWGGDLEAEFCVCGGGWPGGISPEALHRGWQLM